MNKKFLEQIKFLWLCWGVIRNKDFVLGKVVQNFEMQLKEFLEANYIFGVANGTDALILALKAFNIGPEDEVIVPSISFFSTAGAVSWVNARPVFVDVDLATFNIDPSKIEDAITPRTKAIIAVHLNGRMADMAEISDIARRNNLYLVEDAAQAIGSRYGGKSVGYYSDIACLSFNPQKILTAYGDGGALIVKSAALAEKVSMMRTYGAKFEEVAVRHPMVGIASRLNSFQATMLTEKLKDIEETVAGWRRNYFLYTELLAGTRNLILPGKPAEPPYFINGYRYTVLTPERNELVKFLKAEGVAARVHYGVPLPYYEAFAYLKYKKGDFPVAERIGEESLVLPTSHDTPERKIKYTCALIKKFLKNR